MLFVHVPGGTRRVRAISGTPWLLPRGADVRRDRRAGEGAGRGAGEGAHVAEGNGRGERARGRRDAGTPKAEAEAEGGAGKTGEPAKEAPRGGSVSPCWNSMGYEEDNRVQRMNDRADNHQKQGENTRSGRTLTLRAY